MISATPGDLDERSVTWRKWRTSVYPLRTANANCELRTANCTATPSVEERS